MTERARRAGGMRGASAARATRRLSCPEGTGARESIPKAEQSRRTRELIVETDDAALEGIPPRLPPAAPPTDPAASTPALAVVLNAILLLRPSDHSAVLTSALR